MLLLKSKFINKIEDRIKTLPDTTKEKNLKRFFSLESIKNKVEIPKNKIIYIQAKIISIF